MPHHPPAAPASPAYPANRSYGSTTGKPLYDQQCKIQGHLNGMGSVGTVLTLLPGSWRGVQPITLTYQWTRDGTNIAGATTASYTLVAADVPGHVITCVETATNAQGATSATAYVPVHS